MKAAIEECFVEITEDTDVTIEGKVVTVSGPRGTVKREFSKTQVNIEKLDKRIRVWVQWPRKREIAMLRMICSHLRNMMKGVKEMFTYKLKMVHVYFPMSVKVEGDKVIISNFCGEKEPRVAKVVGNANVEIQGDDIIITGTDVEEVGQSAANIEEATKVKSKDPRVFLDGIYIYEKG